MKYHIKPYLKKQGYNLSSLARKLEMSFQRFDHHIKPTTNLSLNVARKLSTFLNLSLDQFIKEVEIKQEDIVENEQFDNQPFGD